MNKVAKFFNDGLAALNRQDLRNAELHFRQVIKLDNSNVPALNLLVVALMSMQKFSDAEQFISKAVSLDQGSDVSFYNYGLICLELNKPQKAIEKFNKALDINQNVPVTWNNRGVAYNKLRKYESAISDYDHAIILDPKYFAAHVNRGKSLFELERYDEAMAAYDKALSIKTDLAEAWHGRGDVFLNMKRYDEAMGAYDKALSIKTDFAEAWVGRGTVSFNLKRYDEAMAAYDNALSVKTDFAEAWVGRGDVFCHLKRYDEALAAYDEALSVKTDFAEAWVSRGNVCFNLKRYGAAMAAYDKALSIKTDFAGAWVCRGNVCFNLKRYDEAMAAYDRALSIKTEFAEAWVSRGNVLFNLKRYDEAMAAYDNALSIKTDLAEAWHGRGNVFVNLKRYDEAMVAYDKALSIKSDFAEAWVCRGNVSFYLKRYDEAVAAYDKALLIKPDLESGAEGARLHAKVHLCNWGKITEETTHLRQSVRDGKPNSPPLALLSLIDSPEDQLLCARAWVSSNHPPSAEPLWMGSVYNHDKIRIGYVSADFRKHAVAYLMAETIELHDRKQFDVTAISLGPDDKSDIRQRLIKSFDKFADCRNLSDAEIARAVVEFEIDILVDLTGFTQDARTNIFACRPAPTQVNYLGYPGTLGASYIDYIIGDKTLFNRGDEQAYSEKLIRLPYSYQPNDRKRQISETLFSREQFGLPEDRFVFCCFNNSYKILPHMFDCWMRILDRVDGSVLWFRSENTIAISNLKSEASTRGVDPNRLVFAGKMDLLSEHLARHGLADLFLDTLPFNAHTTASDALWAGLPVLTQMGKSYAGRVAASLLNAIGLPELIAHSQEEYEKIAIELALNREQLASIKEKLNKNRLLMPLFDAPLFTKSLEAAYEAMYQRYRAGLPPDHIEIQPITDNIISIGSSACADDDN